MTNFSKLMTCPAIFFCLDAGYLDSLAFLSVLIHTPNMLSYFGGFLDFPLSLSTKEKGIKGADIGGFWLDNACVGGFIIKDVGTKSVYIVGTCAERAYIGSTCINNIYAKDAYIGVASDKNICAGSIYIIEHLKMHLQSFWILKVRSAR